jgi:hypothetical protein
MKDLDGEGYVHEPDLYAELSREDFDMDYQMGECRECGVMTVGTDICPDCWAVERAMQQQADLTKAERREAQKNKGRYGPVKHIDPDLRPKRFEKPRVNAQSKFKRK